MSLRKVRAQLLDENTNEVLEEVDMLTSSKLCKAEEE